jgi:hypothetical protein
MILHLSEIFACISLAARMQQSGLDNFFSELPLLTQPMGEREIRQSLPTDEMTVLEWIHCLPAQLINDLPIILQLS